MLVDISFLTLIRCALRHNAAQFGGGGFVNKDSAVILQECNSTANAAAANGGGWLAAMESSRIDSQGGTVSDNAAGAISHHFLPLQPRYWPALRCRSFPWLLSSRKTG